MNWAIGVLALAVSAVSHASEPRIVQNLNSGWRFYRGDVFASNRPGPIVTEKDGIAVTLPHTWNNIDAQSAGNTYYRGACWYRLNLHPAAELANKDLFLRFNGAATLAEVYINGQFVGMHLGNFGAFCFEVGRWLKPGKDNLIAVRVDNSPLNIAPLSGDFNIDGGLYRTVELLALNPLSISPLDDGSSGVYLREDHVSRLKAEVQMTAKIRNETGHRVRATIVCTVRNQAGATVASSAAEEVVPVFGADASVPISLRHPHLWNGVSDPYLYRAIVEVRLNGSVVDRVVQPLGLRFYRTDPSSGFILNGSPYALHGVNKHQDRLNKGWAGSDADYAQDCKLMQELGCTCVRLAHYQHPQAIYDRCDRAGIVVWAELPLVNKLLYTSEFNENAVQQLKELIKQNYNHPSIFFWSLFNELSFPSGSKNPEDWALIVRLNKLAHELDPTRLTTAATSLGIDHPVNFITDVIGINRYFGWYYGKADDWPAELDKFHAKYPNRCIAISEYGAGASPWQHELNPKQPKAGGHWHPEEWQSFVHEQAWGAMSQRRWLWGTFVWNMFDFAVAGRNEGDTPARNDKGLVTYNRATKKDAFFYYKANWSAKPFVYITERRFNPRPAGLQDIKVYSNCHSVELFLNGKSLGVRRAQNHIFIWQGIDLSTGANRVRAVGDGLQDDAVVWQVSS